MKIPAGGQASGAFDQVKPRRIESSDISRQSRTVIENETRFRRKGRSAARMEKPFHISTLLVFSTDLASYGPFLSR